MASLNDIISNIFSDSDTYSQIRRGYTRTSNLQPVTPIKYMEIPICAEVFELPLFAFKDFEKMHENNNEGDMLVASLYSCGESSSYRSFDSIIKDVLSTYFSRHLTKIELPNITTPYYATFGTIFDADFIPLMMLSWILERKPDEQRGIKYYYKRPLLRINPQPCIAKEDVLQKFLAGRLLSSALATYISAPFCNLISSARPFNHSIRVEIDGCPFNIRQTDTPSISVTNEELLQLAAEHIEEIIQ